MKIKKLEVDSKILGRSVYQVEEISNGDDFLKEEPALIAKYKPFYLQCLVDANELNTIHAMEDAGFRFIEFRFKKLLDIHSFNKLSHSAFFPYVIDFISDMEHYREAERLVKSSKSDDRFSIDPQIPGELSQKRLLAYLKKSFDNEQDEFIFGLYNKNTGELLASKSGKNNKDEVAFYHTAVKESLDAEKFTYMIDALIISHFIEKDIHLFYTVTSGLNMMEMDLHISDLKFKIVTASVMLRKIY